MKKLLTIVLLVLFSQLQAQVRIGEAEAFASAKSFLQQQAKQTPSALALSEIICSKDSSQANLFVFSMEPHGFVIVSATNEVLAYSFDNVFPASDKLPDHIAYWLNLYNSRTDYLLQHPEQQKIPSKSQMSVGPLLNSIWGQGCFHNASCPLDTLGPCGHVSAGCVAIAMAQIMYYHKQPLTGNGSVSYPCSSYGTLSANFGQTTYRWDEMSDTLHEDNSAVAELVYHCGVSVKMHYGAHLSLASNEDALNALHWFFDYPSAILSKRTNYSDEEWTAMITENIDGHHPVYYAGTSNLGGHAFVCDGYDSNGLFHFNFGWDGVADGYYTLEDPSGFSESQKAILDFYPLSELPINSDEHGIIYVSTDGTGDGSSWEQATHDLQSAIFKSYLNDCSIWVKEGCYTGNPSKDYAFLILNRCKLYGGFKGDEPYCYDLSQRDFEVHPTILDGNHEQGVVLVTSGSPNDTILIDGFTIQNGNASNGGGLYTDNSLILRNCKICFNYSKSHGGGLMNHFPYNSLIENCEFLGNEAKLNGGAVIEYGSAIYLQCLFHDNLAQKRGGAIQCSTDGRPCQFINCTISNNTAQNGGGIANNTQGPTLWNCLINNNTAETGGGCYLQGGGNLYNCTIVRNKALNDFGGVYIPNSTSQNEIKNCIIWGNASDGANAQIGPFMNYSRCAVQGGSSESGNFNARAENNGNRPEFYIRFKKADVAAGNSGHGGDWRLQSRSLCIGMGSSIPGQPDTDLEGNPRIRHNKIDLGAYESDVVVHSFDANTCEYDPYNYQDSLLLSSGTYTFLYSDTPYDSLVVIHVQQDPSSPIVFFSETICEGETYDFFGTPLTETGHYSTIQECKKFEIDLVVKSVPYSHVSMSEEICEGETYNFFGLNLKRPGLYFSKIDCTNYELDLTVKPTPTIYCSNDTIVEHGTIITLAATGADRYLWSTGDTTASITIRAMFDRDYSVTGFLEEGCSDTKSVSVRVDKQAEDLILYPNPASHKLEVYKPLIDEVEVFNLLGERMADIEAHRKAVSIDVSHFPNGVYIVHIRELNKHSYQKLIVRH